MARTYIAHLFWNYGGNIDGDADMEVTYHITPYDPGITSGPPERCYPPEGGEVEIIKLVIDGTDLTDLYSDDPRIQRAVFEAHEWDEGPDWDARRDRDRDDALTFGARG